MSDEKKKPSCFVIAPIGPEGSETRKRSDDVFEHLIVPCVLECNYEQPVRADRLDKSGVITNQIIERLLDDDLVIADLTELNPNVFYELAIRHAAEKPMIHIIDIGEEIPFDVKSMRAILLERSFGAFARCRKELVGQISEIRKNPRGFSSPIINALAGRKLMESSETGDRALGTVLTSLESLRGEVRSISSSVKPTEAPLTPALRAILAKAVLQKVAKDQKESGSDAGRQPCPACGGVLTRSSEGIDQCVSCQTFVPSR